MNDRQLEENIERLLQTSMSEAARPGTTARDHALSRLKAELRANGQPARTAVRAGAAETRIDFGDPALNGVRRAETSTFNQKLETIMSKLFTRWGFGLTAAGTAGVALLLITLSTPKAQAKAVEVLARGAKAVAKLTSVHLRGQLRTPPGDNFSYIAPDQQFVPIELWKQFTPTLKWRIEKPQRVAVMDGQSTVMFMKPDYAVKVPPSRSAFDTQWLHEMADLSQTLTRELSAIKAHGWPISLSEEQGADGRAKSVITIQAKANLPDSDYLKNKFFITADTRRVYVFDNQSELLEAVRIYLPTPAGEALVFELTQIEYNQPIDASVFTLQVPPNVTWEQGLKSVPEDAQYAAMTAEQAARAFFEACGRDDWTEVEKFCTYGNSLRPYLGGLTLINLGQPFKSSFNQAQFVPYEIKLKDGTVKKHNLALKRDQKTQRWFVDGGI